MKISNSKKQLAKIINENGGWRDGAKWSVFGTKSMHVAFISAAEGYPSYSPSRRAWPVTPRNVVGKFPSKPFPNWHQTILSRDEYFYLYPAPDADGWIAWNGGYCPVPHDCMVSCKLRHGGKWKGGEYVAAKSMSWTHEGHQLDIIAYRLHKPEVKPDFCESVTRSIPEPEAEPTIEQLAADYRNAKDYAGRKQQEADAAKADAEAKLAAYVAAAGSAVGLVLSIAGSEPELAITDWRELQVGDIIECVGDWEREATNGKQFTVTRIDRQSKRQPIRIEVPGVDVPGTWGRDFKFIRRPAKEDYDA